MLIAPPPPAAVIASQQVLPPLAFAGFRAGMPLTEVQDLSIKAGGKLSCKRTSDKRIQECNGHIVFFGRKGPMDVLVSSINDSAAVIVLSTQMSQGDTQGWVRALTEDFGTPNYKPEIGKQESWEWIRRGTMLRVLMHKKGNELETAITLTYGPLLDRLGPAPTKKPGS